MKFNLKNRPKLPYDDDRIHLGSKAQWLSYIAKTLNWFEGFEKELREKIKKDKEYRAVYGGFSTITIKEILGEK